MSDHAPAASWVDWRELVPWDANPRDNDLAVEPVARSVEVYGWGAVIQRQADGHIIAGHTRLKACAWLGAWRLRGPGDPVDPQAPHKDWTTREGAWRLQDAPAPHQVPVRDMPLDDVHAVGLALADNRTGEIADWRYADVQRQYADLPDEIAKATAFSAAELQRHLRGTTKADPTARPPGLDLFADPKSRPGEVYHLGPHSLICGDSRDPATFQALLGDWLVDHTWTDAPYGIAVVGGSRAEDPEARRQAGQMTLQNDDLDEPALTALLAACYANVAQRVRPGGAWYACFAPNECHILRNVLAELGVFRHWLVWDKVNFVFSRRDYHQEAEFIAYGWQPGAGHAWLGDRSQGTLIRVPRPTANPWHPTQKPVQVITDTLGNHVKARDIILDCFGGSGSTLIAADMLGCHARLIELEPAYCDGIRMRWTQHCRATGQDPGPDALEVPDGNPDR